MEAKDIEACMTETFSHLNPTSLVYSIYRFSRDRSLVATVFCGPDIDFTVIWFIADNVQDATVMTQHGRCHRMTEYFSLEGTRWEHLVSLPLQVGSAKTDCQGPHPAEFWISSQLETPQPFRKSLTLLDDFQSKKKKKCSAFQTVSCFSDCTDTSCCVGEHYWCKSGSLFFTFSHYVYIYTNFEKNYCLWALCKCPLIIFLASIFYNNGHVINLDFPPSENRHIWLTSFYTVTWNFLMEYCENEKKELTQINKYLR